MVMNLIHGMDVVQVGAVKLRLLFVFQNADGSQMDISSALEKKARIQKPDGSTIDVDLTLTSGGLNGEAHYLTASGDINATGFYKAQGWVKFSAGFEGWSLPIEFRAASNLPAPAP